MVAQRVFHDASRAAALLLRLTGREWQSSGTRFIETVFRHMGLPSK